MKTWGGVHTLPQFGYQVLPNTGLKARAYYSDSVIRNLTPSLRRPLEPSQYTVGMSDTQCNSIHRPIDLICCICQTGESDCGNDFVGGPITALAVSVFPRRSDGHLKNI